MVAKNPEVYSLSQSWDDLDSSLELSELRRVFRVLHDLSIKLHSFADIDSLYKVLVETAREVLEIDRVGILLFSPDLKYMYGTFGTDTEGNTTDERNFKMLVPEKDKLFENALTYRDYVVVRESDTLSHMGQKVGRGWNAMYALWDNDRPYGWLSGDNLLKHRPLGVLQRELFGIYGSSINNLITRKKHDLELQKRVDQKTQELEDKMRELVQTREYLLENEKLVSLGNLVAGIAHEINTPIGNAISASSFWRAQSADLKKLLETNNLTKNSLVKYIDLITESGGIIQTSLERAAELITNFKKLAVNSSMDDHVEKWNVRDLLNSVVLSYGFTLKKHQIKIEIEVNGDIVIATWPGAFSQIFSNLLQNAILHAFEEVENRKIKVQVGIITEETVEILYQDNGVGIPVEVMKHLFEPFVTTKRGQGGSGLGMSIVYSSVTKSLKGTIEHFAPQGGGTGFRITIPQNIE